MNKFGKLALTATSLAPILGAMAMHSLANSDYLKSIQYLIAGVGLVIVCWLLLWFCKRLPQEPFKTSKVKTSDKEVLSFLVIYLLPIFTKDIFFSGDLLTPVYVIVIIAACIYNSNSFTFNPVLSLMGYHFYEVDIENGMSYLLITRNTLKRNDNDIQVRELSDYIYLQT